MHCQCCFSHNKSDTQTPNRFCRKPPPTRPAKPAALPPRRLWREPSCWFQAESCGLLVVKKCSYPATRPGNYRASPASRPGRGSNERRTPARGAPRFWVTPALFGVSCPLRRHPKKRPASPPRRAPCLASDSPSGPGGFPIAGKAGSFGSAAVVCLALMLLLLLLSRLSRDCLCCARLAPPPPRRSTTKTKAPSVASALCTYGTRRVFCGAKLAAHLPTGRNMHE
mmetsp:Transcript_750/g.2867  ORF Transcript_750/g.2867 Transcript_750/m.2867 type:complete len:225 (+) Transcript_750:152-826(+)